MTAVPDARTCWRSRAIRIFAVVCLCGCVSVFAVTLARAQDVQAPSAEATAAPLREIRAIRTLMLDVARRSRPVLIRGTVTYINEREPAGIIVHDGRAGVFVR